MDINNIFIRVNEDIVKKGKGGYSSNDEFNRTFNDVQNKLLTYYIRMFELHHEITDATLPFRKSLVSTIRTGKVDFPTDYRHLITLLYNNVTQSKEDCSSKTLTRTSTPMPYLPIKEKAFTLSSGTRKPNLKKGVLYHDFSDNKISVYPEDLSGSVKIEYFSQVPVAIRNVEINQTEMQEDYLEAGSIHPVWPDQEEVNLISLMLLYKGIEIKDNDVVQWAMLNKQL